MSEIKKFSIDPTYRKNVVKENNDLPEWKRNAYNGKYNGDHQINHSALPPKK